MGRIRTPGLIKRGGVWHIDKRVTGYGRVAESCGTASLEEAERFLVHRMEVIRQATVYGVRPTRTFREAADKYVSEHQHKRSIDRDVQELKHLDAFIGHMALDRVHIGTLQPYLTSRAKVVRPATVNRSLAVVRRILNLAARLWRDEHGLTWLLTPPLIQFVPNKNARQPYPLSWDEQRLLFAALPAHLARMALFKVNTGTREQEVVKLQWDWECPVMELGTSVFVIPKQFVKNSEERLIVLNDVARSVIDEQRGVHATRVFTYKSRPVTKVLDSAWRTARKRAAARYKEEIGEQCPDGFRSIRVHDLKHTFGRRLRAVGVSMEDRQDLLGHKSSRITTHYSSAELTHLIAAADKVCVSDSRKSPAMTLIRSRGRLATA